MMHNMFSMYLVKKKGEKQETSNFTTLSYKASGKTQIKTRSGPFPQQHPP